MKKTSLVTKSNQLNEARYRLTATEQKLILSVVSMIQPKDEDFKIYKLEIQEFINLLGLKSTGNYSRLKNATHELLKKTLTIKEENKLIQANWFSSIVYHENGGQVEFRFDPNMKPYFIQLKQCFVSYYLSNILRLQSPYSIRIYELLKQYERIGKRSFKIEDLRFILGIEKIEYSRYSDFKTAILKNPQKELENKTDITFDFQEIKKGRKISEIIFNIKKTKKLKKSIIDVFCEDTNIPDSIKHEMLERKKLGINENLIIEEIKKEYNI